jgi:hypothetical protein
MCRLSRNLGPSASWNPRCLSRPVQGLLYLYLYHICISICWGRYKLNNSSILLAHIFRKFHQFNNLKHCVHLKRILNLSFCLTENTLRLYYKGNSDQCCWGNKSLFVLRKVWTHKCILWERYRFLSCLSWMHFYCALKGITKFVCCEWKT